jgi:hypothetical protein
MTDRMICGWRVRSALPLPETVAWLGDNRPVDIEIQRGSVPDRLGERAAELPYVETAPDGRVLFDATPIARYLITSSCVVVDAAIESSVPAWRSYLLGPVLAVICYLRGALPLHASALRVAGRAIAIAGKSGAGKSTLAAALSRRGHSLITDDISVCTGFPQRPLLLPTYSALRLNDASLRALGFESKDLAPVSPDLEKYQLPLPQGFDPAPVPLEAVYLIEEAGEDRDIIVEATGTEAFERLTAEIYRPPIGRLLLTKPAFFAMATQLATEVAVRRLLRRPGFSRLEAQAQAIEADLSHVAERAACQLT